MLILQGGGNVKSSPRARTQSNLRLVRDLIYKWTIAGPYIRIEL